MCKECGLKTCPGVEKLRCFTSVEDLKGHLSDETVLKFVNHYAIMIAARDNSGKRYRLRQQAFTKVAKHLLDADELERIVAEAEEKL